MRRVETERWKASSRSRIAPPTFTPAKTFTTPTTTFPAMYPYVPDMDLSGVYIIGYDGRMYLSKNSLDQIHRDQFSSKFVVADMSDMR